MFGREELRYVQLVATEAREFAVWPIGRRPPRGWRVVPFAGTLAACGRHVAELHHAAATRSGGGQAPQSAGHELVGLLAKAAGEQPDAVALSAGALRMTYRQLWEHVEELAARLGEAGVGPGGRVAVVGRPPADLVVVVVAVLVAGATCVLAEGGSPEATGEAVRAVRPDLVLAPAGTPCVPPWWPEARCHWSGPTGSTWHAWGTTEQAAGTGGRVATPASAPVTGGAPAEAALVVSASPDGTGVVWRGQQLAWLAGGCGLPRLGCGDRLLPLAPLDATTTLVVALRALLTGAELALPADGDRSSATGPVPARWRLRVERADGSVDEIQVFGFAETTMLAATVDPATGELTPLPQTRGCVLDGHLASVPRGQVGELYLAGTPLAAGYLDRPELTMGRFLPDPSGAAPGSLMFRTGLLARQVAEQRFSLVGPASTGS
ncbi:MULTISPECIES: AMP-binding protein [Micromonospora]|uniref:AMP-binding enzyme n=1 Tax=Micromonospora yangpuensis TaxID=683228 RepID=A0A1C6UA49_9ACTN|nr:AMP-binding protein [Micromonospora yangpuensis]GGL87951.1 hypothetical protein GCM10012279_02060 [Micromonospora yangpuensis]SCL50838.1 AMP-binding enzyme [Micromonospora yangpuensis]